MNTVPHFAPDGNIPERKCHGLCGRTLPLTPEFFHRHGDGFQYYCKQCRSQAKPKREIPEGHKWCNKGQHSLPATSEYFGSHKAYKGRKARLNSICRQCKVEVDKDYNASHREERKQYKASRKEEDKLYMAQWRREHHEELKQYDTNYRSEHREQSSRQHKIYCNWYYKTERGRIAQRIGSHNRRARKKAVKGTYTPEQIQEQLKRQKYRCYYAACGHAKFPRVKENGVWKYVFDVEHTFPIARVAGSDIPANDIGYLVLSCHDCNQSKGRKFPWEWFEGGRLL